jgi:hypothetical protein
MDDIQKGILVSETKVKLEKLKQKLENKQVFCTRNIVNSSFKDIVKQHEVVRILEFGVDYVYQEYYKDYCFSGHISFDNLDNVFHVRARNMNFSEFQAWINGIFVEVLEMYRVFALKLN